MRPGPQTMGLCIGWCSGVHYIPLVVFVTWDDGMAMSVRWTPRCSRPGPCE